MSGDNPDPTLRTPGSIMWHALDAVVDELMATKEPDISGYEEAEDILRLFKEWSQYGQVIGRAQGMATIIAISNNHHHPRIDSVRAIAMERYEKRQSEEA